MENEHSSGVQELLANLNDMKEKSSYLLNTITDYNLLIEGLTELDKMIEMDEVKESIVSQVKFLLINAVNESAENFDGHMVHTVLSGVPGVGKTATGVILAKIWTGLGLLNKRTSSRSSSPYTSTESEETDLFKEMNREINSFAETEEKIANLEKQIVNLRSSGNMKNDIVKRLQNRISEMKQDMRTANPEIRYNNYRLKTIRRELANRKELLFQSWVQTLDEIIETNNFVNIVYENSINKTISDENVSFTLAINTPIPQHFPSNFQPINNLDKELKMMSRNADKKIRKEKSFSAPTLLSTRKERPVNNFSDLIRIVSREDFVGGFLGQTALKTESLLRECLGKVVFIDEAYSLVNDEKDSYGKEALTCLNRFMSEHSHEIIVIFAGYKDLMEQTIFKYQPGLKRRCSWYFEIKEYSANGLAQIFEMQLKRNGWTIDENINMVTFFKDNKDHFPAFGGDTLRLAFYCKICYSNFVFDDDYPNKKLINEKILNCAFDYLKNHRVGKDDSESSSHLSMFM